MAQATKIIKDLLARQKALSKQLTEILPEEAELEDLDIDELEFYNATEAKLDLVEELLTKFNK